MSAPTTPSLAIVIPTLDEVQRAPGLVAALHPLLAADDELWLVDGGSGDGTVVAVRALTLPRVRVLEAPPGRARQMNHGAACAAATWLLFLHADSVLSPGALGALRAAARGERGWGYFRVRIDAPGALFRCIEAGMNLVPPALRRPSGDQALFVRRDLFHAVGGFPDVPLMEDLLLSDRLLERGPPARLVPSVSTSARRWRARGPARTVLSMWGLRVGLRLGVSPARLARRYPPVR